MRLLFHVLAETWRAERWRRHLTVYELGVLVKRQNWKPKLQVKPVYVDPVIV